MKQGLLSMFNFLKSKNLEVQMGQMANMMNKRPQGTLPSTSEVNPRREGKEHCKAITLRIGKTMENSVEAENDAENVDYAEICLKS